MSSQIYSKLYDHNLFVVLFYIWLITYSICHAITVTTKNNVIEIQCVEKERNALLHFKDGIEVDRCGLLDSWEGSSLECCQWRGIRCDIHTGHVTSLNLHGKGILRDDSYIHEDPFIYDVPIYVDPYIYDVSYCLEGTIRDSLVELKHLTYLDLSFNDFNMQSMPKFIGLLSNLEYLNLSGSNFWGLIPNEIGNLTKLSSLDLSYTSTSGGSLSWLPRLKLLRNINLSGVDLSSVLNWASIINHIHFLEVLRMDACRLSTKLPSSLSYINASKNLHVISLGENFFNDASMFQWLYNLSRVATRLSYVDLSSNNFSGLIPSPIIYNINSLSYLDLSVNNFSGQIPSEIWTINNLSYLSVSHNHLEGSIPNTISNLQQLVSLDLSYYNKFQVSRQALKSIGKLCRLQTLKLDGNNLTHDFSQVIESLLPCACKSLVSLCLSNTQIWGSVPNIISKFSSLEKLTVDRNCLNGTIGEGIGKLSMLNILDLSSNYLNGVLSQNHFSNLSSLRTLYLSDNKALILKVSLDWTPPFKLLDTLLLSSCKIGPAFPKWLSTLKNLTGIDISDANISDIVRTSFLPSTLMYLNMSHNMIYGVLPDLSITLRSLRLLDMNSNNLSGVLPSFPTSQIVVINLNDNMLSQGLFHFLCPKNETVLQVLDLSNNLFSETLPDCWEHFPRLFLLHLQNNNISGKLPSSLVAIEILQILHLRNNSLYGELPVSWAKSTSLVVLDVGYNSLSGCIPPSLGLYLKYLQVLSLRNNHFSMGIPSTLCQLSSLQILDLSGNNISGSLPKCLYNLTTMSEIIPNNFSMILYQFLMIPNKYNMFDIIDNAWVVWKRKERNFNDFLGLYKGIDISDNNLQGQIPDEISSLVGLVFLNLSQNRLSGSIPSNIGNLTALEFLDLSHNHISGEIPASLASISDLAILDLSNNDLSGRIPTGTQLQGFDTSAYMKNPGLCGAPLPICPGDEVAPIAPNGDNIAHQKEHDSDDLFLGLVISVVLGIITGFWAVCGTLALKRSWRHAYFRFCDDTYDRVYVMVVVFIARARRRFSN